MGFCRWLRPCMFVGPSIYTVVWLTYGSKVATWFLIPAYLLGVLFGVAMAACEDENDRELDSR